MSRPAVSLSDERRVLAFEATPSPPQGLAVEALAPAPEASVTAPPARKRAGRTLLIFGTGLAVLTAAGYYGHDYWTVGRFNVSTDDAYVQADNTTVAPKVSGYIGSVLVADNETVKTGQVLARIDDRDFAVALQQARADVAAAHAAVDGKQAQLDAQQSVIETARATIGVDQADAGFAEQDNKRLRDLGRVRLWQPAERPAGGVPDHRGPCRRHSGYRGTGHRAQADRPAEGGTGAGTGGSRA